MRGQNFFYNLIAGLQRLFVGRNGFDHLTAATIVAGFLLRIIARFVWIPWFGVLYYALFAYSLFRMFSRNISKRQKENAWFLDKIRRFSSSSRKRRNSYPNQVYYTYLRCPGCGQQLRVPSGKGAVNITCPKCGRRITTKV